RPPPEVWRLPLRAPGEELTKRSSTSVVHSLDRVMSSVRTSKTVLPLGPAPSRPAAFRIHTEAFEINVPPAAQSLEGFRAWAVSDDFPERGRIAFLDGEVFVDMSPEEIHDHGQVKLEITTALFGLVKKLKSGQV